MRRCGMVLALLALVAVAGCNSGRGSVKKVDVSGKITAGGEPVDGVTVYFVGDGHTGTGVTRSDGSFDLMTGAAPGNNLIYFKVSVADGVDEDDGMDEFMMSESGTAPEAKGAAAKIPKEFMAAETTTLKYEVPDGGTDSANFKL